MPAEVLVLGGKDHLARKRLSSEELTERIMEESVENRSQ